MPHAEISPAIYRAMIGHLNNPGCARALCLVIQVRLLESEQEKILHQIFCFSLIPQNAACHAEDNAGVAMKKYGQSFLVSYLDTLQQLFVCEFADWECGLSRIFNRCLGGRRDVGRLRG